MRVEVTTYCLEMLSAQALNSKYIERDGFDIVKARVPLPELNRFFYTAVGGDWYWTDRLDWTYEQWQAWVDRPAYLGRVCGRHSSRLFRA